MTMKTTESVAFGVPDLEEALDYYCGVMGFEEVRRNNDWIELSTGTLKVYLCPPDGHTPCLNVDVDDQEAAVAKLCENGAKVYSRTESEVFVEDKYGHCFCVSVAQ